MEGSGSGQQPASRPLGHRVGGQREAAGDLAQHYPAVALGVVLTQPGQRLHHLALGDLAGVGQALHRHRLRGQEQQRLDGPGQVVHDAARTMIGPKELLLPVRLGRLVQLETRRAALYGLGEPESARPGARPR